MISDVVYLKEYNVLKRKLAAGLDHGGLVF